MPIFKSEQFLKMARLTISGHDHERKSYKAKNVEDVYESDTFRWSSNVKDDQGQKCAGYLITKVRKKLKAEKCISLIEGLGAINFGQVCFPPTTDFL